MTDLSIQQLFGENAYQDLDKLVIQKSDLIGLVSSNNNSAESLLAAILLVAWREFEGNFLIDSQRLLIDGCPVLYNLHNSYESLDAFLWRVQLVKRNQQSQVMHTIVFQSYSDYD
jgi:hypothetical protein